MVLSYLSWRVSFYSGLPFSCGWQEKANFHPFIHSKRVQIWCWMYRPNNLLRQGARKNVKIIDCIKFSLTWFSSLKKLPYYVNTKKEKNQLRSLIFSEIFQKLLYFSFFSHSLSHKSLKLVIRHAYLWILS